MTTVMVRDARWTEVYPELMPEADPIVVVLTVPDETTFQVLQTVDGRFTFGVVQLDGETYCLQVYRDVGDYVHHVRCARAAGLKFLPAEYVGPLSGIPQQLLMKDGTSPLVFLHDAMHRQFYNLKKPFMKDSHQWN